MHFPADAIVRRYRENPEKLARLAEALHDHAMHINDEVELSFADQRVPVPSPEDIVRRAGW